jgi:hypothetical protein
MSAEAREIRVVARDANTGVVGSVFIPISAIR